MNVAIHPVSPLAFPQVLQTGGKAAPGKAGTSPIAATAGQIRDWFRRWPAFSGLFQRTSTDKQTPPGPANPFVTFRPPPPGNRPEWGIVSATVPVMEAEFRELTQKKRGQDKEYELSPTRIWESQSPPLRPITICLVRGGERPWLKSANHTEEFWAYPIADLKLLRQVYLEAVLNLLYGRPHIRTQILDEAGVYQPKNVSLRSDSDIREALSRVTTSVHLKEMYKADAQLLRDLLSPDSLINKLIDNPDPQFPKIFERILQETRESLILDEKRTQRADLLQDLQKRMRVVSENIERLRRHLEKMLIPGTPDYLVMELAMRPPLFEPHPASPMKIAGGWRMDEERIRMHPNFERFQETPLLVGLAHETLGRSMTGTFEVPHYARLARLLESRGIIPSAQFLGEYAAGTSVNDDFSLEVEFAMDANGFRMAGAVLRALAHDYAKAAPLLSDPPIMRTAEDLRTMLEHLEWASQNMFWRPRRRTASPAGDARKS